MLFWELAIYDLKLFWILIFAFWCCFCDFLLFSHFRVASQVFIKKGDKEVSNRILPEESEKS